MEKSEEVDLMKVALTSSFVDIEYQNNHHALFKLCLPVHNFTLLPVSIFANSWSTK